MNMVELIKHIKEVAASLAMVQSVYSEDVYINWNSAEARFASVNVAVETVTRNSNNAEYGVVLYYADRLLQDKSNSEAVYTDAVNVLQSILNNLDEDLEVVYPVQYTPFSQKFADYLAGAYCRVTILAPFDICSYTSSVVSAEEAVYSTTFTSDIWEDENMDWYCGKRGYAFVSGVQVTSKYSGAYCVSKNEFDRVKKVTINYFTNASTGAGDITVAVGKMYAKQAVTKTGGKTPRSITFEFNKASGAIQVLVECTTNSIYIQDIQVTYEN